MSEIKHIVGKDFEKTINSNEVVLIDFYATWCPPCKMLTPVLEELQDGFKNVLIVKIDVDAPGNEELVKKFKVMSIPTLVVFKNGEEQETQLGFKDLGFLTTMLKKYL